jgi:anti-sigma B factor antagonist
MRDEPLSYTTTPSSKPGVLIFKLSGPLTLANMFTFQNDLKASTANVVIVDLTEVPYMDSAGLGVILNYHVSSARKNQKLILAGTNARVHALLEMTKVDKILTMTPDLEAAESLST